MPNCNDIPAAKDLKNKTPFDVQGPSGIIQFSPFRITRGEGRQKWHLAIDGFCNGEPSHGVQYHVLYKGAELGATMKPIKQMENGWQARLETIIPNPEFWGES